MFLKQVSINFDSSSYIEDTDWDKYAHNCLGHQAIELKDMHEELGGFPDTYCYENTMFYQKFFERDEIDFDDLGTQVGLEAVSVSMIKQPPGMINPAHKDTFYQINKRFPDDTRLKVRANIQLLDWKMGHFLQFNDTVVTHWKTNTGYAWDSTVLHLAVNAGFEDRYSLQISGFYNG